MLSYSVQSKQAKSSLISVILGISSAFWLLKELHVLFFWDFRWKNTSCYNISVSDTTCTWDQKRCTTRINYEVYRNDHRAAVNNLNGNNQENDCYHNMPIRWMINKPQSKLLNGWFSTDGRQDSKVKNCMKAMNAVQADFYPECHQLHEGSKILKKEPVM